MPLRGVAKAKNFTLGPTAPMKTFTENVHIQTKDTNVLISGPPAAFINNEAHTHENIDLPIEFKDE